ncbi:MAG: calcium/sodium antiporter [Planctomycetes bacterium]|nr:calcium/sodium antiporter [Planctomycetota bacterium]
MVILALIGGLVLLTAGAEVLVRGASGLARAVGLPSLIIGLTVVAFGTSAPELAVSVKASVTGQADLALGNVVGSNIFNVLFILGVSALIAPLVASAQLVRLDVPVMIGASGLVWLLAMDGSIGRVEGVGLLLGIVAYTALLIYLGKRNSQPSIQKNSEGQIPPKKTASIGRSILFVAVGLVLLVLGARWLVDGAVELARMLGVSELMIGLTIVAAGTSMPEVATSVVASIRGERDIAIGNVVGSNIFNIMAVLGASAVIAPNGVAAAPAALRFDIPVMAAIAFACLPVFFTGGRISRWEGAMFLGYYGAYVAFLILTAVRHTSLAAFSSAMLWFVIPISTLGVAMSVLLWTKKRRREAVSE